MRTSICWELTCDGVVSHSGGVKDSHPLNTTETRDKYWLHGPLGLKRICLKFRMLVQLGVEPKPPATILINTTKNSL